jgi:hypothetical protein
MASAPSKRTPVETRVTFPRNERTIHDIGRVSMRIISIKEQAMSKNQNAVRSMRRIPSCRGVC